MNKENDFDIEIIRLHWFESNSNSQSGLKKLKEENDLDAHGEILVKIGGEIISEPNLSLSLSTAGLFLMRTCFENYNPNQYNNKLIPHCGHSIYPSMNKPYRVNIYGCDIGYDWNISHQENIITHKTLNGNTSEIKKNEYFKLVKNITDKIENFYKNSKAKEKPKDETEREGFEQFWLEWKELKKKITTHNNV
ncbi:hypothetical protein [Polaribacter sp. Asnod1-A03]|uniref:hypothetical protein n=1 Tax=Polaribacter sp. Asnod1-A03 TaxID=3160581 RepID=UPI0038652860